MAVSFSIVTPIGRCSATALTVLSGRCRVRRRSSAGHEERMSRSSDQNRGEQ
ncbi:hypothetical protein WP1_055 [Pseudomonas phage WP1]